jgi:ribosome-binding protein aMBF1 (putative translation factor)
MTGGGIDGPLDQLVKARWLAIGLSQTDLAEVLGAASSQTQRTTAERMEPTPAA